MKRVFIFLNVMTLACQPSTDSTQGALGSLCGEHADCASGLCAASLCVPLTCGDGTQLSNGVCVATTTSLTCGAGTTVSGGVCVVDASGCAAGTTLINGVCVLSPTVCADGTSFDAALHTCSAARSCGAGTTEVNGVCTAIDPGGPTCATGTTLVNGACVSALVCGPGTLPSDTGCVPAFRLQLISTEQAGAPIDVWIDGAVAVSGLAGLHASSPLWLPVREQEPYAIAISAAATVSTAPSPMVVTGGKAGTANVVYTTAGNTDAELLTEVRQRATHPNGVDFTVVDLTDPDDANWVCFGIDGRVEAPTPGADQSDGALYGPIGTFDIAPDCSNLYDRLSTRHSAFQTTTAGTEPLVSGSYVFALTGSPTGPTVLAWGASGGAPLTLDAPAYVQFVNALPEDLSNRPVAFSVNNVVQNDGQASRVAGFLSVPAGLPVTLSAREIYGAMPSALGQLTATLQPGSHHVAIVNANAPSGTTLTLHEVTGGIPTADVRFLAVNASTDAAWANAAFEVDFGATRTALGGPLDRNESSVTTIADDVSGASVVVSTADFIGDLGDNDFAGGYRLLILRDRAGGDAEVLVADRYGSVVSFPID